MNKLSTGFIHRCAKPVGIAQDYARYLTALLPSTLVGEPVHRIARKRCLVVLAVLCVIGMTPANATKEVNETTSIDTLKLYAHSRIMNYKEFICFHKIITKESQWSHSARNGSHYGLGQMRSTWYRDLDPFRQIDATIKYNQARYSGQCKAWAFHLKHGYY
jgi:hypothetical protein